MNKKKGESIQEATLLQSPPLSFPLSRKFGREEKIKTNPSVSPFRKGRN